MGLHKIGVVSAFPLVGAAGIHSSRFAANMSVSDLDCIL